MILLRSCAPSVLLGTIAAVALATSAAWAGEDLAHGGQTLSRCRQIGNDFIDMGNGTCARVAGHVRVQLGTREPGWGGTGSTSTAAMRSYEEAPAAGARAAQHLRVQSGIDPYGMFR